MQISHFWVLGVFWVKTAPEGLPGEPQLRSCSKLCGYKMAVKPLARPQRAQSHLGRLILEKQGQNLQGWPGPGPAALSTPAPPVPVSTLADPFPWEQLGVPKRNICQGPRGRTISTRTRPCSHSTAEGNCSRGVWGFYLGVSRVTPVWLSPEHLPREDRG